jgi:predicted O-methyltransferase YrrM
MYSRRVLAQKYLHYYFTAANGKGHGVHSPFVYDFIIHVLNDRRRYPDYDAIEALRRRLRGDESLLEVEDLGAGSAWKETRRRSVGDITRRAAKAPRLGQLLYRIARYYRPGVVLELGTSLGFSAAYLGKGGGGESRLWTVEGSGQVAEVARKNLAGLGLDAEVVEGNFDEVLPELLARIGPVDLVFVDGNHRREPTLAYFKQLMGNMGQKGIIILDDIHWSAEMEEAWGIITRDPRVYLTVDLFFIGIVFLREEFKVKQNFTIRY